MIFWVAQEAEERGDDEIDDAGFVEKRKIFFMRARVIFSGSRKNSSMSPHSVTCVCQIDN